MHNSPMQDAGSSAGAPADDLHMVFVLLISITAAMGGLLFGYDWVVIGGAKDYLFAHFHVTGVDQQGWLTSCALVGALLGSICSAGLSDRFGRKLMLLVSAAVFFVSSIFTGLAGSIAAFTLWRIAGGLAIGLASNISPMYIAEISPARWRGRLVALNQLTIVIGVLAAQITDWLITRHVPANATTASLAGSWYDLWAWRWMFIAVACPSALFFICSLFVPESPRWLIREGRLPQAHKVLSAIGGEAFARSAGQSIQESIGSESLVKVQWKELLHRGVPALLVIGVVLAVLQQWSGINVIFNYATDIYRRAGYTLNQQMFNIVITGVINLVFTFVALFTVDRIGRRTLMLIGCSGIGLSHLAVGWAFYAHLHGPVVLAFTLATIAFYAMSLAPVTWVLISEIFPNRVRGAAVAISVSALWIACFALTYSFQPLTAALGIAGTFWLYSGICLAGCLFVFFSIKETKGQSLEELEQSLHAGRQ